MESQFIGYAFLVEALKLKVIRPVTRQIEQRKD